MISTAEFKKQIGKPFGQEMRAYGFKGYGFEYFQETENLLIAIFISTSRWGRSCIAEFAIHPKEIDKNSIGKIDLKKLKIYQYEFIMSLTEYASGELYEYSDDTILNLESISKIINSIKEKALPVIEMFKAKPSILELFKADELVEFHKKWTKKTGVSISTTDIRFAWAMTMIFEKKNENKAKKFAKYGLSQLSKTDTFFGRNDFERVMLDNKS